MGNHKSIPHYLAAAGLFVILKFGYTLADNNDLLFLLKPTDFSVSLLTGSQSVYSTDNGYYHKTLNILIDKSCSGFNFWLLSFLLYTFLLLKYCNKTALKLLAIPASFICAYLLTIFANSSRIFTSIIVQSQTESFFPDRQHLIHEAVGIITNLFFLVLAYYLTEKVFNKKQVYEKFS